MIGVKDVSAINLSSVCLGTMRSWEINLPGQRSKV